MCEVPSKQASNQTNVWGASVPLEKNTTCISTRHHQTCEEIGRMRLVNCYMSAAAFNRG